jgi:hypothetical protein
MGWRGSLFTTSAPNNPLIVPNNPCRTTLAMFHGVFRTPPVAPHDAGTGVSWFNKNKNKAPTPMTTIHPNSAQASRLNHSAGDAERFISNAQRDLNKE